MKKGRRVVEIIDGKKECSYCKEVKDISEFYKDKTLQCGYSSWCNSCKSFPKAKWNKKNYEQLRLIPEEIEIMRQRERATYAKHRERRKEEERIRSRTLLETGISVGRSRSLKSKYNLSEYAYIKMLDSQNHMCPICNNPLVQNNKTTHVDHCHNTGKVRGLLCHSCNVGLGSFKDNIESLQNAINYLKFYK